MTSRFERRLARIEKLQRPVPKAPSDPRGFVLATLVGFHWCDRGEDEHPLQAYIAAAKGPDGEAGMQALLDGFFAAHRVNLDAEPTPDALRAMQRLLDGMPEQWRDAEVAWWPARATDMWARHEPGRCRAMPQHSPTGSVRPPGSLPGDQTTALFRTLSNA